MYNYDRTSLLKNRNLEHSVKNYRKENPNILLDED